MTDTAQTNPASGTDARVIVLGSYGLYFAAFLLPVTAIIGVVLAYIKRTELRDTVWESHLSNLIHVFWVGVAVLAVWLAALTIGVLGIWSGVENRSVPLIVGLVPAAWLGALLFLVWYAYRTIKGFLRAVDSRPYT